jgi:hypothetical protein
VTANRRSAGIPPQHWEGFIAMDTEKQKGVRAKSNLTKARKSADELSKAATAVAELSKKNPEQ